MNIEENENKTDNLITRLYEFLKNNKKDLDIEVKPDEYSYLNSNRFN